MFSFRKKDKEKDKEKKEKHEKKKKEKDEKHDKKEREKKERQHMTPEEMSRIEEMKKGVFRRFSDKDKKRHSQKSLDRASPSEEEEERSGASSRGSPTKDARPLLTRPQPLPRQSIPAKSSPPPVLPKPKVKSILKGKNDSTSSSPSVDLDDTKLLQENTKRNEDMFASNFSSRSSSTQKLKASPVGSSIATTPSTPGDDFLESEEEDKGNKNYAEASKLKLPPLILPKPPRMREIVVKRLQSGGFGFSLRKGLIPDRSGGPPKAVTFAEPGSGPTSIQTGLLPGDRLIEVNGQNVENLSREEVVEVIKKSLDTLTLKVQPIPELIELSVRPNRDGTAVDIQEDTAKSGTLRRSGSLRYQKGTRSEDDVKTEKAWLEAEKVWLIHRGGFSEVFLLKSDSSGGLAEGRVRVKLESGDIIEVDEDDIEKANPPQFDRSEDLASLRYLNESSALHTLRQRYASNLIHTYSGPYLLVVNPMQHLPVYAEKIIQMLKGCKQEDMPPHVFSMGQMLYRDMLSQRRDQSLLLLGKSGSGKTTTAQHVLHYLITAAAGHEASVLNVEKLASVYTLLHAFGNSRTSLNVNASRFTQIFTLDFDHSGQIGSASVQALMFEKTRVVRRPEGEPTFSIFYQLLAGVDSELRSELQLQTLSESNLFMSPPQKSEDKQRASEAWARVVLAFDNLNVSQDEVKAIFSVLAAIYHLGNAGAIKGPTNKPQFAKPAAAQRAATLLGISVEELSKSIFTSGGSSTLNRSTSLRVSGAMDRPAYLPSDANATAQESLEGFVIGLYSDVFNAVVSLINRSLSSSVRAMNTITIVDGPGFQSPGTSGGRGSGATFEDLCHNYTQERLQAFFHEMAISLPMDTYSEEDIELDFDPVLSSPASIVNMLDKPPLQGLVRSSTSDLKNADKKGLLWILDEEAMFPGATEDSFMERLLQQHSEQPVRKESLLRKGSLGHTFVLNHQLGTTPIQYNAQGWLRACRENPTSRNATLVLQDSKKSAITQLFTSLKGQGVGLVSGSVAGMEGSTSLRRVGSMRRTFVSGQAGLKKKSVCLQVKFNVDSIVDILKKTNVHFIHCVLPHHWAGLGELRASQEDNVLNIPLVRNQLRGFEILDAVRLYRQGFPDSMPFPDFISKFEPLVPGVKSGRGDGDEKIVSSLILDNLDVDKLNYRVGNSRVFFRPGCLTQLDSSRDEKFTGVVEQFQALCRGYLARKNLEKLKVQHTAIRCIQRNVRKYVQIREWEWWRLYTKVKPILNVHRTEEELKEKEAEIELLKSRNEKLEKERSEYKTQCDRLENRLAEVTADLAEENTTSNEAAELLEAETAERLRLEKELRDLQNKFTPLKRQNEKLQMEMMQTRLWQAEAAEEDLDGEKDDDSVYKPRYERLVKELQVTKKQMQQHHEEEMEAELQSRKLIERRLHEAVAEAEEQRRQVQVAKKKAQRLATETQDMKLHLEEHMARNNELERKQRRFDSELSMAHEDAREEKTMREKLQRERDGLLSESYAHEQALQQAKMEHQSQVEKCERLEREMNDLITTGKDNTEAVALKRSKHELEGKIQEQEEELDDQAGQIQQLEQAKLRLEMNLEKSKQQHVKDLEEKDEEMEEMRYKTQKKLRQMESQLEEEYEQKKRLHEEKAQLERQLQESGAREPQRDRESEKRLRRNLRKTKALLNDAGAALLKQKDLEGARAQISALRNQLDDAEFASAAAVKAKKRMELEIQELQQQMEELTRGKQEAESKSMGLMREKADLQGRLEEVEEDLNDIMKKYKAAVQQQSVDQITLTDQMSQIEELMSERDRFKQEVSDLQTRVQSYDETMVDKHTVLRLETKGRDMESRLDLEGTIKQRLESQVSRLKEQVDRVTAEKEELSQARLSLEEVNKRTQKQMRELREELGDTQKRELEGSQRRREMETRVEELEGDQEQNQSDLKLALKRITDLQAALEEDLDSDSDVLVSDSEDDEDDSADEDLSTFLSHQRRPGSTSGASGHVVVNSHSPRAAAEASEA
ncbi:unconventional myosin-XVIIIa [Aplysia californica]|uniref:Unconventional myosin-XVIIIa n=1 Tax=Aplysia californica TaxID=6500 RepID=A0ABM0ZY54_APLCA|nr:unconventional myosin-XVIIIa [Aplysia californica]